jgi:hypothetical protein
LKSALIELHYLPSLEYFCALRHFDEVIFEKHEHFVKQSYRNRCYINTASGIEMLSIPLTEKHGKVSIKDVKIDYSKKWQNNQWRTIESAYRNAPYFEHYGGEIQKAIYRNFNFLFDLNLHLLSFCLQSLKWNFPYSESVSYEQSPNKSYTDLRSVINAKKSYVERSFYKPVPYYQVFGNCFVENLSLLDSLFCEGPHTSLLISQSRSEILNK